MLPKSKVQEAIELAQCKRVPRRLNYKELREVCQELLTLYYCVPACTPEGRKRLWDAMSPCHSRRKFVALCAKVRGVARMLRRQENDRQREDDSHPQGPIEYIEAVGSGPEGPDNEDWG